MGAGERFTPFRYQCAELRSLQNMRHQGSQPEHHLGSSRGRRRAELSEYVNEFFTHIPHARPATVDLAPVPNPNLLTVVRTGISPQSAAVPRTLKPNPPKALVRSTQASRCCPYPGLQRRWTCPIRAVIAGRAQTVHFAQCGRAEGVRPPDGVNRDPFATFAACGGGRN